MIVYPPVLPIATSTTELLAEYIGSNTPLAVATKFQVPPLIYGAPEREDEVNVTGVTTSPLLANELVPIFESIDEIGAQNIVSDALLSTNDAWEPVLIPIVVVNRYVPDADTDVFASVVHPIRFCENTPLNLPSWNAAGITAGLAVDILAIVTPFEVANDELDKVTVDADVSVCVPPLLLLNLNACVPFTWNSLAPPLFNEPNPNNCESADDCIDVEPPATEEYDIPYPVLVCIVLLGNIVPPTDANPLSIR